jgi:glycine oxidase
LSGMGGAHGEAGEPFLKQDTGHVGKSVAVVGGGIIGMSIAWRLAQRGLRVTVYEKSLIGGEASWAGAGMLAPGGEFDADSECARLAVESRGLYPDFVAELEQASGLPIDFQETGALDLAFTVAELTALAQRRERQKALGIVSKRVSAEQIGTYWPHVRKQGLAGGYFYPGDASVNPRDIVAALRVACGKEGVLLVEGQEVTRLDLEANDAAVIAAGAWSGSISVGAGPPLPPSEPVRGHLLGYRQPQQICNTILRHGHTYLLQRANGLLIAGASVERVGFERGIDQKAVERLEAEAAFVMPHLGETSPAEIWNGFRPASDGLHIGLWHSARVYLAYGHYRNGILLAPATAQRITREISANLQTR